MWSVIPYLYRYGAVAEHAFDFRPRSLLFGCRDYCGTIVRGTSPRAALLSFKHRPRSVPPPQPTKDPPSTYVAEGAAGSSPSNYVLQGHVLVSDGPREYRLPCKMDVPRETYTDMWGLAEGATLSICDLQTKVTVQHSLRERLAIILDRLTCASFGICRPTSAPLETSWGRLLHTASSSPSRSNSRRCMSSTYFTRPTSLTDIVSCTSSFP